MLEDEPGREQVLADTIRASEEWGFFQVINHGVPDTLMDAAMEMSKRFFALTSAEKEEFKMRQVAGVGYGRFVVERPGVAKDWVDRLQLNSVNKDELEVYDLVLNNPPGCQGLFEKYGNAVYELARRILAILSEGMEQNSEFFYKKTAADGFLRTSINYYPPCPQPDLVMGTSCHEDASSITILQQDDVCGLEVPKVGNWVSVSPIPHAFVVKIGDILQVVSNDKLKSVSHRAVVAGHTGRISIANFLMPRRDTKVQPATELCSKTQPSVFGSMEYGRYLVEVVATNLLRNKVDTLRIKHPVYDSSS